MRKKLLAAIFVPSLLMIPACGKKGPIQLPLVIVPQKVETLKTFQRGSRIVLEWTNPESYIDGRHLKDITEIEVWVYEIRDLSKTGEKMPSVEEFKSKARRAAVLEPEGKPALPEKPRSKQRAPVAKAKKKEPAAKELFYEYLFPEKEVKDLKLIFALRVRNGNKGRFSDFSELAAVVPRPLPSPPQNVRAEVFADRIELRWAAPAANFDGSTPASVKGYNVYNIDKNGHIERRNAVLITETMFADRDFLFGQACRYVVRAAAAPSEPFFESDDSLAADVLPRDVFPPAVPSGLSAATGPDFITLIWDANRETDLAGYNVWRREEGGEGFVCLTKSPLPDTTYTDRAVEKGKTYEYAVTAVDAIGNESARSAAVSETIKRLRP